MNTYMFNYLSWSFALSIHLCISIHLSLYVHKERFDTDYDFTICYMYSAFETAYRIQPYVLVPRCVCSFGDTAQHT